jgi:hypothetical protein
MLKLAILAMALLICAGCGDTINNTTTTAATTTPAFVPYTTGMKTPPPTLAGAAAFVPSNTYCTQQMNTVFAAEGNPLNISVLDGPDSHHQEWLYETPALRQKYYFTWSDTHQQSPSIGCTYDFYKSYIITP